MNRVQDRFWDWATESFIRFGGTLLAIHAILTTPLKRRRHHG